MSFDVSFIVIVIGIIAALIGSIVVVNALLGATGGGLRRKDF